MNHLGQRDQTRGQINQKAERAQLVHQHRQHQLRGRFLFDTNTVMLVLEVISDVVASGGRSSGGVTDGSLHLRGLCDLVQEGGRCGQGDSASDGDLLPEGGFRDRDGCGDDFGRR